ncbi:MAG TPA: hypothetical protein VMU62_04125 [Acidobacteriaceae bacterium]|nr:hypothetical protein [Acidobacteriaceae bacterium]
MALADALHAMQVYNNLLLNPVLTLQQHDLMVNPLPAVNCATVRNLWFAAYGINIVIDQTAAMACGMAGGIMGPPDCGLQRAMVVSPMRGHGLPIGAAAGARHRPTGLFNAAGAGANLWVTEMQTGCSVLIVEWGGGQYSMTHLQPSQDAQFNLLGRAILSTGSFAYNAYKNTWLKQELTAVVSNTGGAPQRYILIQSMFETARGPVTQVLGVRNGAQFNFYRQRQTIANRVVEHLQWSTWRSYLPYFSY